MLQSTKILKTLIMGLAVIAAPTVTLGQVGAAVNLPGGQNVTMVPGSYDQYLKTPVFMETMKILRERSAQAANLYQESAQKFYQAYREIDTLAQNNLINPAVSSMSANKFVSIETWSLAVSAYTQMKRNVELQIAMVREFPNSLEKRLASDASGMGVESVPTIVAGLRFDLLAKEFELRMNALDEQLKAQKIQIKTINRGVKTTNVLDLSLIAEDYDSKIIEGWMKEIEEKRFLSDEHRDILTNYTMKAISQMDKFFKAYGTEEAWRWNVHGKEYDEEKATAVKELADTFFQRSYFRMKYGVHLGYIGIKYDRKKFGLDRFFTNLNKLTYHPVSEDTDFYNARTRELAELLKTAGAKGQKAADVLKGEVGFLQATNSLLAAIMGQDQVAQAMVPVVAMLANDLVEENMIMTGRRNELILKYKARYYSDAKPNPANPNGYSDREVTLMREIQIDFSAGRLKQLVDGKFIPVTVSRVQGYSPESTLGFLQKSLNVMYAKQADFALAATLQAKVDAYNESLRAVNGEDATSTLLGVPQ